MHGGPRPWLALARIVTLVVVVALALGPNASSARPLSSYSTHRKQELRHLAEDTWRHAYDAYKRHAFPADELLPLSCSPQGHDRANRDNAHVNDVMGDYLLTVVDSLDTLAMLGDKRAFEEGVREVIDHVSFDVDSRVQVFEVTIRMMGGLVRRRRPSLHRAPGLVTKPRLPLPAQLSAHLLALEPSAPGTPQNGSTFTSSIRGFSLPWYRSELLHLAHDLGRRLLPAFDTPTGIPFARVHLQTGMRGKRGKGETGETCAAGSSRSGRFPSRCPGQRLTPSSPHPTLVPPPPPPPRSQPLTGAGSLLLEFITLSRLTGDPTFELAARRAFFAVWNRRSDIGLVGNTIDARTGVWLHAVGGTGAGIDSFYECVGSRPCESGLPLSLLRGGRSRADAAAAAVVGLLASQVRREGLCPDGRGRVLACVGRGSRGAAALRALDRRLLGECRVRPALFRIMSACPRGAP